MMKFLVTGSLLVLSSTLMTAIPAKAQNINSSQSDLSPRTLISLARQGRFESQGIPGYSRFISAVKSRNVNAEELVASAVAQNRLPETALQDREYLNAVDKHLSSGGCGSN